MSIEPFEPQNTGGKQSKPQILLLEIRDRGNTSKRPVRWVFVRREEHVTCARPRAIMDASISLTYEGMDDRGDRFRSCGWSFNASYNASSKRISLTGLGGSRGGVLVAGGFRGFRLGTCLFNEVISWAKQWEGAQVNSIELSPVDGAPDNRGRRNRFYEQFGLVFDYTDAEHRGGASRPMPVNDLRTTEAWRENITEQQVPESFAKLLRENWRLRNELEARERAIKDLVAINDRKDAHPIRAALAALWAKHNTLVVVFLIVVLVLITICYRLTH